MDEELRHDAEINKISEAAAKVELLRFANTTLEEIGYSDEERIASLKALHGPANDAAEIAERKNLTIE